MEFCDPRVSAMMNGSSYARQPPSSQSSNLGNVVHPDPSSRLNQKRDVKFRLKVSCESLPHYQEGFGHLNRYVCILVVVAALWIFNIDIDVVVIARRDGRDAHTEYAQRPDQPLPRACRSLVLAVLVL